MPNEISDASKGQLQLFEEWLPLRKPQGSHYPSILGLTSMFLPVKDRKKYDTVGYGDDAGQFYQAGEYQVQRRGPGLSTYDEDTLIAILQLSAQHRIVGSEKEVRDSLIPDLPVATEQSDILPSTLGNSYFVGTITPYKINKYFTRDTSGAGLAKCMESIIRLKQTDLTIRKEGSNTIADTHFFSLIREKGENATVTVVIDPIMGSMLQDFVILDLMLRRKLTPVGKGVYRYLAASGVTDIPILELMEKIGISSSVGDFNRALLGRKETKKASATVGELQVLKNAGWLTSYEINGTGRNIPFVLEIQRP